MCNTCASPSSFKVIGAFVFACFGPHSILICEFVSVSVFHNVVGFLSLQMISKLAVSLLVLLLAASYASAESQWQRPNAYDCCVSHKHVVFSPSNCEGCQQVVAAAMKVADNATLAKEVRD